MNGPASAKHKVRSYYTNKQRGTNKQGLNKEQFQFSDIFRCSSVMSPRYKEHKLSRQTRLLILQAYSTTFHTVDSL